jgi:hypothetical protein
MIFISDIGKFTLIYFSKKRSDVYHVFLNFQKVVDVNLTAKLSSCKLIGLVNIKLTSISHVVKSASN